MFYYVIFVVVVVVVFALFFVQRGSPGDKESIYLCILQL